MNIALTTHIDAPAHLVWTVLADEFVQVSSWLTSVVDSYALPDAAPIAGAPIAGRVCQFTEDPNGLQAHETITYWSEDELRLDMDVVVKNAPPALPISRNLAQFQLFEVDGGTEVRFSAEPSLKPLGYVLYPVLKRGLSKQFGGLLAQLKTHVEARHVAAA